MTGGIDAAPQAGPPTLPLPFALRCSNRSLKHQPKLTFPCLPAALVTGLAGGTITPALQACYARCLAHAVAALSQRAAGTAPGLRDEEHTTISQQVSQHDAYVLLEDMFLLWVADRWISEGRARSWQG